MIKSAQYFFIVFLFLILYSLFFIPSAFAQTIPANTNPDVPNNLHTFTQSLLIEVTSSLTCLISGVDPVNPQGQCLGIDPQTHKIGYVQNGGGAIGAMGGLIAMTFTPPAHTRDFVGYLSRNFGIAKPAYADNGIGFTGLSPLLGIWTAFRNITYLVFVIVFIVIGFAIMFRVHIDPRTVMTIENQIPKIIIALILVTFSFAIAGFLIDLMYVFMYLAIGIFSTIGSGLTPALNNIQGVNVLEYANNLPVTGTGGGGILGIVMNASGAVKDILMSTIFSGPPGTIIGGALGAGLGLSLAGTGHTVVGAAQGTIGTAGYVAGVGLCAAATGGVGLVAGAICGAIGSTIVTTIAGLVAGAVLANPVLNIVSTIVAFLVIGVAILFALFRLWFTLIKAYVFILIDVVFAPFWIIAGLIPGGNISFVAWLREIGGELIAFPATIIMFLLGKVFIDAFGKPPTTGQPFIPPLIGNAGDYSMIGSLIGLGIILMTPSVVDMMKAWLKAPKLDISAIGHAIGAGAGVPGRIVGGGASTLLSPKYDKKGQLFYPAGGPGRILRGFGFGR